MITPVNFKNIYSNQINNKPQNNRQFTNLNQLQNDSVCFTGAVKILSDICDKAFVNTLTKSLNLDEKSSTKLKDTIWKFLRENKASSLGDLGGEEHFDEQVELQGRITKALSIREDDNYANEYIADELIRRCDDGKNYIPLGPEGFGRDKLLENILSGENNISMKEGLGKFFNDNVDNDFYKFAKKMLRQSPEESYEFRKTIDEYLKENNIKSITELFSDEDLLNEQACLIEKLENEFNLSETESTALHFAFHDRADTDVVYENFKTGISPYIKDFDSIGKIAKNMGLSNHKVGHWNFNQALYREMSTEAEEKGLENVFELVKSENNFKESATYKFIKEKSGLSEEEQANLIIELAKVAKDPEAFAASLPKHEAKDNFYANLQSEMIADKIAKAFNLGDTDSDIFEDVISKKLKKTVMKMFPSYIDGGKDITLKEAAFEIADTYKLPLGAEKTIENIIKEVQDGGTKSADVYLFGKLTSELGIE